jgi:hypothetical protein
MTIEQMQALAEANLGNGFDGQIYNEKNDPFIDVDNMNQKVDKSKRFGIKITSNVSDQKRLVLHPAILFKYLWGNLSQGDRDAGGSHDYFKYASFEDGGVLVLEESGTVAVSINNDGDVFDYGVGMLNDNGISADAYIRDGVCYVEDPGGAACEKYIKVEGITGATVEFFRKYVNENPTAIKKIVINSNDVSVYSNTIFVDPVNPFTDQKQRKIYLNDYFKESAERTEKITVDLDRPIIFDDEHVIAIDIPGASAGETVEVTMEFLAGATHSKGRALRRKTQIAKSRDAALSLSKR